MNAELLAVEARLEKTRQLERRKTQALLAGRVGRV